MASKLRRWPWENSVSGLGPGPGSTPAVLERTPSSGLRESPLGSARPSAGADPPSVLRWTADLVLLQL